MEEKVDFSLEPEYVDESKFSSVPQDQLDAIRAKAKPYFNQYVLKKVREKPNSAPEQIMNDMMFYSIIMRVNQLAKDTFLLRRAGEKEKAEVIYNFLHIHRKFLLDAFGIEEPDWTKIQNELEDDVEVLNNLSSAPVTESEFSQMDSKLNNM